MTNLFHIRQTASELLTNTTVAIDLYSLLNSYNIRFREADLGSDIYGKPILGACKSLGLKRLIVLSNSITNHTRRRFTLAHEIGHIFLHHENKWCSATDFAFWSDKLLEETEANTFASELLLPYTMVVEALRKSDIDFKMIDSLAQKYETSTMATAIRLVKEDKSMSAVVYHDGARIEWAIRSSSWHENIEVSHVNERCITMSKEHGVTTKQRKVNITTWLTIDDEFEDWVCSEETRCYPKINKYLTVLNIYEQ